MHNIKGFWCSIHSYYVIPRDDPDFSCVALKWITWHTWTSKLAAWLYLFSILLGFSDIDHHSPHIEIIHLIVLIVFFIWCPTSANLFIFLFFPMSLDMGEVIFSLNLNLNTTFFSTLMVGHWGIVIWRLLKEFRFHILWWCLVYVIQVMWMPFFWSSDEYNTNWILFFAAAKSSEFCMCIQD